MNLEHAWLPSQVEIKGLLRRMELEPSLLRRQIEEQIVELVDLPDAWLEDAQTEFLAQQEPKPIQACLDQKGWSIQDLRIHLARPEALRRFSRQRFGPGLEEQFLTASGGYDVVLYSFLRVRDPGLARELWIRLSEGEITFAEAASSYSEGPESQRKGLMGPIAIGALEPQQLREWLHNLRPGELRRPEQLGEWQLLIRLEQLTPARFDEPMQQHLLQKQMDQYLNERVTQILAGEHPEPLHYNQTL